MENLDSIQKAFFFINVAINFLLNVNYVVDPVT